VGLPGLEPGTSSLSGTSGDAFKLLQRETPAQRPGESDRGCPLGTEFVPPLWHAGGTAGKHDVGSGVAAMVTSSAGRGPVQGDASLVVKPRTRRGSRSGAPEASATERDREPMGVQLGPHLVHTPSEPERSATVSSGASFAQVT
jgi:hypothetical protein